MDKFLKIAVSLAIALSTLIIGTQVATTTETNEVTTTTTEPTTTTTVITSPTTIYAPPVVLGEVFHFSPNPGSKLAKNHEFSWGKTEPGRTSKLQAFLGIHEDGNYGPITRDAHIDYLESIGLDTDIVPSVPVEPPQSEPVSPSVASPESESIPAPPVVEPAVTTTTTPPTTTTEATTDDAYPYQSLILLYFGASNEAWAHSVMRCESGYNPNAVNSSSGASGLFQFIPSTWTSASQSALGYVGNVFDPESNIKTAAWLYNTAGSSPWVC